MAASDLGMPAPGHAFRPDVHVPDWKGPYRKYDLVKEVTVAFIVVVLLTVICAVLFSSPDDHPITIQQWATHAPLDFVQTAITELDGTSATAQYGPPYTHASGSSQYIGPVSLEKLAGVTLPINTAEDFVIHPLSTLPGTTSLHDALLAYQAASPAQQQAWTKAFETAAQNGSSSGTNVSIPKGNYGPVGTMMSGLLSMAQSGALDGVLISSKQFYTTDYTKVLLFLADGSYLGNIAQNRHLLGEQWGMMNETGSYPGQAWLWLYTMWYQVQPFASSSSADALVWGLMMVLSLLLLFVPLIPGLRSIPRGLKIYRLIWRRHYRMQRFQPKGASTHTSS